MKKISRRQFWTDHIARQEVSGQSIRQYAVSQGLNLQSLYMWRSALKKSREGKAKAKSSAISFAKIVNVDHFVRSSTMRIREAGLVIEFDDVPSPEWLHRFLQLKAAKP